MYTTMMKAVPLLLIILTLGLSTTSVPGDSLPTQPVIDDKLERPQNQPDFPKHWGHPPRIQVRDHVKLPGNFGFGSSTVAKWISDNLKKDGRPVKVIDPPKHPKPSPKEPVKPVCPPDIKQKIHEYKKTQKHLQEALRTRLKSLGATPSKEEIRILTESFREDHAKVISKQKRLSRLVKEWELSVKPPRKTRPEPTAELKEKLEVVRNIEKSMVPERNAAKEKLSSIEPRIKAIKLQLMEKTKNKELLESQKDEIDSLKIELIAALTDKKDVLSNLREAQKEKHLELKIAKKQVVREVRQSKQTGETRD